MGKERKRKWLWIGMGIFCLIAGLDMLIRTRSLQVYLLCGEGKRAFLETILFFGWMLVFFCIPMKPWLRWAGAGLGIAVGTWCHQILLPFLVSGCWLFGILLLGDGIGRLAGKKENRLAGDFLAGAGGWISLVCLLSAFSIGGLGRIRLLAAGLTFALLLGKTAELWRKASAEKRVVRRYSRDKGVRSDGIYWAVMITMVFIQLARLNQGADYDSLHYGLRSPYILDSGRGIYENLGNINLVYTYPKGFEILSFPMAGTSTYGYLLCFNVWLTILALTLIYGLVRRLSDSHRSGMQAAAFASMIPGMMNMAITAKSDIVTLVCQLGILSSAAGLLMEKGGDSQRWFSIALGSCLLSYAMKPTAFIFSTAISLTCLVYLWANKGVCWKEVWRDKRFFLGMSLPGLGAWAGTWIRTYRMTGVPSTSVFTSVWELLGFTVRWPYAFSAIPDQGLEMGLGEGLIFWLKRLYGLFFCPVGEDMGHVVIAWGTGLVPLFFLAWLLWGGRWKKAVTCIAWAAGITGILSLVSIYLLWQVDGNYFMLLYVLAVVLGTLSLSGTETGGREGPGLRAWLILGCTVFQAVLMLGANWAGTVGFTPVSFRHKGYYPHQQMVYEDFCSRGNQAIWTILSQDPRTRVIAVGEHPRILQFPCNVQSYYDVTGSGGNVRLVKTLEDFKSFLRFAGTEYIYVQEDYLEEGTRVYDVIRYLIEEGSLADIRYENRNILARVNLDGQYPAEPEKEAEKFYQSLR